MRRYAPAIRKILLVLGVLLLVGLAVHGPTQYHAGYTVQAAPSGTTRVPFLENFAANVAAFRAINSHPSPPLDLLFAICWYLGNGLVLLPVLLILIAARPAKIKYFLVTVAVQTVVAQALKYLADQPRPLAWLDHVRFLHPLYSHSFPSGDVALAFGIACSLLPGESRGWKAGLLIYAALIAVERVYAGVHTPLDVLTGAAVGAVCAWVVWKVLGRQNTPPLPLP